MTISWIVRFTPTADDATLVRGILCIAGVKARVRRFPKALRVVVLDGAREDAEEALSNYGFKGCEGGSLVWGNSDALVYKFAA